MKRFVSALLTCAMVCSLVPLPAFATMANELEVVAEGGGSAQTGLDAQTIAAGEDGFSRDASEADGLEPQANPEEGDAVSPAGNELANETMHAQGAITGGSLVDENGVTWKVDLNESATLSLTDAAIPEGEDLLDLTLPAGPVDYNAWNGDAVQGTVTAVASNFTWSGTDEAQARVHSVHIPNLITSIDCQLFNNYRLANLEVVTFEPAGDDAEHAGVKQLPHVDTYWNNHYGFFQGSNVRSITLPTGLETLDPYTFSGCGNLESLDIPAGVQSIGNYCFYSCGSLTQVTLHEGLKSLGEYLFSWGGDTEQNRPKVASIQLPNSLEEIGYRAFYQLESLTSVDFGSLSDSRLTTIGDEAFEDTRLVEARIPNSVTTIGLRAFASLTFNSAGGHGTLEYVRFGTSQEESQLQSVGTAAFFGSRITSVTLPNKLTYMGYDPDHTTWSGHDTWSFNDGTTSRGAFYASTELATIVWPTQPPKDGLGLTHVGGFDKCPKLSPSVVANLPAWIDTIDYAGFRDSFKYSGVTSLSIPASITRIEPCAFSGTVDAVWNTSPLISSITFEDGDAPLSIGEWAFDASGLMGKTVILPRRVAFLGKEVFDYQDGYQTGTAGSYYVYNKDIQFTEGTSPWAGNPIIYYPSDTAQNTGILALKRQYEDNNVNADWIARTFRPFDVTPKRAIVGTVPDGATVRLQVNGTTSDVMIEDGTTLSTSVEDGSMVMVVVRLDGYADYAVRPEGGRIGADWEFSVAESDMTPLATTGTLAISVTKSTKATERENRLAAIGCNVAVFDTAGRLAAHGTTPTSAQFVANNLAAGDYTVVAFDKNEFFSAIGGLGDFTRMGVQEGSWVQELVHVYAEQTAKVTLEVPDLKVLAAEDILDSGSVVVTEARIIPECAFYVRVSYGMKEAQSASQIHVSIPEGLTPVSVATLRHNYGDPSQLFDPISRVLTIDLRDGDTESSTVYVGLKVQVPGTYGINASVACGAAVAPLGSASISAPALVLEVPQSELDSTTFDVDVYAAPDSAVYFKINSVQITAPAEEGSDESPLVVTTNKIGHATATLVIPDSELGDFSRYVVTAQVKDQQGSVAAQAVDTVEYRYIPVGDDDVREWELSFVHDGAREYVVRNGTDIPNASYTVSTSAGAVRRSPTWPFVSVLDSTRALGSTATLVLKMIDGSLRYETMTLTGKVALGDDATRYTYVASVPLGDVTNGLRAKDIPFGLEVAPSFADEQEDMGSGFVAPQVSQDTVDMFNTTFKTPELKMRSMGVEPYVASEDDDFWKGVDTRGLSQDELDQILGEIDLLDVLIHEKYKHQNWQRSWNVVDKQDIDVYDTLTNAQKAEVRKLEEAVDEALIELQQAYGDNRPLNQYESLEDYLYDNYGYRMLGAESVPNPSELESQGYQVIYDTNAAEGAATWYAMRVTDVEESDQSLHTQASMGELASCLSAQGSAGDDDESDASFDMHNYLVECYNSLGQWWHKRVNYDNREELDNFWRPQSISLLGAAIENCTGYIAAFMAGNWNPQFMVKWEALGKSTAQWLGYAGAVLAAKYVYDSTPKVKRLAEERNKVLDELHDLMLQGSKFELSGLTDTPCYKAMVKEMPALVEYATATILREHVFTRMDVCGTACFAALGLAGGKVTSAIVAPVGFGWAAMVGWLQTAYVDPWAKSANAAWMKAHNDRLRQCQDYKNPKHKIRAGIDPSGYVYEAVEGNTLQGVLATIQYSEDGGVTWSPWDDAFEYEQTTTQVTDGAGVFAWDVPMGLWRVAFLANGYGDEDGYTYTSAMEVPPERKGLAVPLVSRFAPTVQSVTADDAYVEVVFNQYMSIGVAPAVTMAGRELTGGDWADPTPASGDDGAAVYARVWRVSVPTGTQLGKTLPVTVAGAYNYAGNALGSPWEGNVTTESRPAQIVLDYKDVISQPVGTQRTLAVRVTDANGSPVEGASVAIVIGNEQMAKVDNYIQATDASGVTSVKIDALLPGTSEVSFSISGTSLTRRVPLLTTLGEDRTARPIASFGTVTVSQSDAPDVTYWVDKGTEVSFTTEDEGAKVFYTIDGSDPTNVVSRREYEGPVAVTKDLTLRAVSYIDGKDFSNELTLDLRQRRDISKAVVKLSTASYLYDGSTKKPTVTVTLDGVTLRAEKDYTLSYENNQAVGIAKVTITGKGTCAGKKTVTFNIMKAVNPMVVATTRREVLKKRVRKKAVTVAAPVTVSGALGKVTYAKVSGNKNITVNAATGKVTLKKGTKKGSYTIKIKVSAAGDANHAAATKIVSCKIAVVDKYTNPIVIKAVKRTASAAKAKKKAVTVAAPLLVTKAKGRVIYKKTGGSKKLSINAKTGKVTVKKGTKAGTYTIKVKVTAAGNGTYKRATQTATCKITVT